MKFVLPILLIWLSGCAYTETSLPNGCTVEATVAAHQLRAAGIPARVLHVQYHGRKAGHAYAVWAAYGKMWAYDAHRYSASVGSSESPTAWVAQSIAVKLDGRKARSAAWLDAPQERRALCRSHYQLPDEPLITP